MVPCLLLFFFYLRIFTHTIRVRQRAQNHNQLNRRSKIDLTFSIGLFSSLIIFSVTFVPYFILLIVDYEDKLPRAFHLYGLIFIRINSCLNPILYGTTNTTFKDGYKNFLNLIFNKNEYEYSLEIKQKKIQRAKELEEQKKIKLIERQINQKENEMEKKNLEMKKLLQNCEEIVESKSIIDLEKEILIQKENVENEMEKKNLEMKKLLQNCVEIVESKSIIDLEEEILIHKEKVTNDERISNKEKFENILNEKYPTNYKIPKSQTSLF